MECVSKDQLRPASSVQAFFLLVLLVLLYMCGGRNDDDETYNDSFRKAEVGSPGNNIFACGCTLVLFQSQSPLRDSGVISVIYMSSQCVN